MVVIDKVNEIFISNIMIFSSKYYNIHSILKVKIRHRFILIPPFPTFILDNVAKNHTKSL